MNLSPPTPCLLLHGLASNMKAVLPFKDAFESFSYPCFIPELPGHRLTIPFKDEVRSCNWDLECHTYVRYLTQNFKNKILVSGQSFGTLLALKIAITYPHLVKGLILFSPSIKLRNKNHDALISLISFLPSFVTKNLGTIKKSKISSAHSNSKEEYSLNVLKHLGLFRRQVLNNISQITAPIYVIQSINDYHLAPTSCLSIKEKATNSNVHVVLKDFGEVHNLSSIPQINGIIKNGLDFICQEK